MTETARERHDRMLTFRSGGWVIIIALLISCGLALWALWGPLTRGGAAPTPNTIESYGFDLFNLRVPKDELIAAIPRDSLPRWDQPPLVPDDAIAAQIRFGRDKYLVSTDRVVGVIVNGEARCYPISVLTVHEVINDTMAGVPIAVTYHPWCDSVVVFERRLSGEAVELAASGLLIDSNQVLYDRRDEIEQSSLFRQLTGEAIAGPAANGTESLAVLPSTLTTWENWRTVNPETSVIGWDERLIKRYEGSLPDQYFRSTELAFPVEPLPPASQFGLKDRVMAVSENNGWRVYPYAYIEQHADESGRFVDPDSSTGITIQFDRSHGTAELVSPEPVVGRGVQVIYAMWFAWFAAHGDADVVSLGPLTN